MDIATFHVRLKFDSSETALIEFACDCQQRIMRLVRAALNIADIHVALTEMEVHLNGVTFTAITLGYHTMCSDVTVEIRQDDKGIELTVASRDQTHLKKPWIHFTFPTLYQVGEYEVDITNFISNAAQRIIEDRTDGR